MMLHAAIDAFLSSVTEREFDEPLLALLRAEGYTDIHFVHGSAEYGKDVIARKNGQQWAFQSKAGKVNTSDWREIRYQIDELRLNDLSHPALKIERKRQWRKLGKREPLDRNRKCVLVTTGRLTNQVSLDVQDYNQKARRKKEPEVIIWDRETLIAKLVDSPNAILSTNMSQEVLNVISKASQGDIDMDDIEVFSRRWLIWEQDKLSSLGVLEANILASILAKEGYLDLSCHIALCLMRAAWCKPVNEETARRISLTAEKLFRRQAEKLWGACKRQKVFSEMGALVSEFPPANIVTCSVKALRVMEILSLLGILLTKDKSTEAHLLKKDVAILIDHHPGCSQPISDRYAHSAIPAVLFMKESFPETAQLLIERTALWLYERYDEGELGIAAEYATVEEEIQRLLGGPYENISLTKRNRSYAACVLLDLASLLNDTLYNNLLHDIQSLGMVPTCSIAKNDAGQYVKTPALVERVAHIEYFSTLPLRASHHSTTSRDYPLGIQDCHWEQLAIQSVLRDRHQYATLHHFLQDK